jgi:hypothetical protein
MRYVIGFLLFASPAMAGEPAYSWQTRPDDLDRIYLYQDGKQIGGWCYSSKHYRSFDGKEWGPPTSKAPTQPPANRVVIVTPPVQRPAVVMQPSAAVPRLRGPLRARAANVFSQAIVDGTMRVVEEIPGAILDSILKGNFELKGRVEVK